MFKLAAARRVLAAPGRRAMSGTSIETGHTLNTTFRQYAIPVIDTTPGAAHHHHEEVELWKKITAVGSVVVSACFLNWMATDHHHMHTPPPYPCAHGSNVLSLFLGFRSVGGRFPALFCAVLGRRDGWNREAEWGERSLKWAKA